MPAEGFSQTCRLFKCKVKAAKASVCQSFIVIYLTVQYSTSFYWVRDKRSVVQQRTGIHVAPNHISTTNQINTPPVSNLLDKRMARLKRSPKQPTLRPSANNFFSTIDSRGAPSPGLTVNLSSNNPFRNRAVSPANSLPSPVTSTFNNIPSTAPERPISRNPFLDQPQLDRRDVATVQLRQTSPERDTYTMAARSSPKKPALTGHAVELFVSFLLPIRIMWKSTSIDSASPRITSRSTMGLPPTARQ